MKNYNFEWFKSGVDRCSAKRFVARAIKNGKHQLLDDLKARQINPYVNTLESIAERNGCTREYVRQVEHILFGKSLRIKKEPVCRTPQNPISKVDLYEPGSNIFTGAIIEKEFYNKCKDLGYKIEFCKNHAIDLVINDKKVEVKGSLKKVKTSHKSKIHYHHYGLSKKQLELSDFIACYHESTQCFFIIPTKDIKSCYFYISSEKTYHVASKNRFWEYKDRFDLLSSKPQTKP